MHFGVWGFFYGGTFVTDTAVDVAVRLGLQDNATPGIDRAAARAQKAVEKTTATVEQNNNRQRTSYERASQAREVLGTRSEQRIQREIAQTEAAYNRLMRAGTMSAREQSRALEATRSKVTQLTNEMGKLTQAQEKAARSAEQHARGVKLLQTGGAVLAGGAAAAYTLREPVRQAMGFDERLAHMANTSFRERDVRGRRAGMGDLRNAIDKAQQTGGGTREGAAEALDALIASGAMDAGPAMAMLPSITKAASAANADPAQLANIGIRAMQTFKISADDMPNIMNMALAAGQAGGFELKDMSKWLPQQMAAATMSGMSGKAGFAKLAALNQAAAITAGTKDEAGNNVVNLLSKINSSDTAKDAQKMGVDLPKYLQEQRGKGVDSVDAFGALVQGAVSKRGDYQELQKKLKGAGNDDDRKSALEGMATIAQGAGIGKLIQDRQALMALLGMMNNSKYMSGVLGEVNANDVRKGGAVDKNHELIAGTGAYRARQAEQALEAGKQRAIGDGGPLGAANDAITALATKFPVLTGSATLTATALGAAAAAAGLFTVAAGGGNGKVGTALAAAAGRAAPYLPSGKTVGRAGLFGAGAMLGGAALGAVAGEDSAVARYGSSALNGAAAGAFVGSVVPVLGTAVGAAVGGALGLGFEAFKDLFVNNAKPQEAPQMQAKVQVELMDVNDRLMLRLAGTQMQAKNMDASFEVGNIHTGAPL